MTEVPKHRGDKNQILNNYSNLVYVKNFLLRCDWTKYLFSVLFIFQIFMIRYYKNQTIF